MMTTLGIEGNILNWIKNIYSKSSVNNILNDEKVEAFLLESGTRQGYPLWPLFLNITLEILVNAVRQDNKRYTDWQGRNKVVFVHRWYDFKENLLLFSRLSCIWLFMTSFVKILKKLVELINDYSNVEGYRWYTRVNCFPIYQTFLYASNEQVELEIINNTIYISMGKMKYLGFSKVCIKPVKKNCKKLKKEARMK